MRRVPVEVRVDQLLITNRAISSRSPHGSQFRWWRSATRAAKRSFRSTRFKSEAPPADDPSSPVGSCWDTHTASTPMSQAPWPAQPNPATSWRGITRSRFATAVPKRSASLPAARPGPRRNHISPGFRAKFASRILLELRPDRPNGSTCSRFIDNDQIAGTCQNRAARRRHSRRLRRERSGHACGEICRAPVGIPARGVARSRSDLHAHNGLRAERLVPSYGRSGSGCQRQTGSSRHRTRR